MPSMRIGSMKGSQLRHLVMCATTVAAMTFMTGCEKPVIAAADAPAVAGGVEFKLGSYELRYLELTAGDETFEYPSPVLIIPVTITNNGENELTYTPTHCGSGNTVGDRRDLRAASTAGVAAPNTWCRGQCRSRYPPARQPGWSPPPGWQLAASKTLIFISAFSL